MRRKHYMEAHWQCQAKHLLSMRSRNQACFKLSEQFYMESALFCATHV